MTPHERLIRCAPKWQKRPKRSRCIRRNTEYKVTINLHIRYFYDIKHDMRA